MYVSFNKHNFYLLSKKKTKNKKTKTKCRSKEEKVCYFQTNNT